MNESLDEYNVCVWQFYIMYDFISFIFLTNLLKFACPDYPESSNTTLVCSHSVVNPGPLSPIRMWEKWQVCSSIITIDSSLPNVDAVENESLSVTKGWYTLLRWHPLEFIPLKRNRLKRNQPPPPSTLWVPKVKHFCLFILSAWPSFMQCIMQWAGCWVLRVL